MRGVSGRLAVMDLPVDLTTLSADQLRTLAAQLTVQLADREREVGEKERELQCGSRRKLRQANFRMPDYASVSV